MADIHIGIGGNIGAGKTEFVRQSLKEPNRSILLDVIGLGSSEVPERIKQDNLTLVEEIPDPDVLRAYYDDPKGSSFMAQAYFFDLRVQNQHTIANTPGVVFEDRTLSEDMEVFGRTQHEMGLMSDVEWTVYSQRLYPRFTKRVITPHLWVYLKVADVDILMQRIKKRGREVEQGIDPKYIECLNKNYDRFCGIYTAPHLVIDFSEDRDARGDDFYTEKFQAISDKIKEIRRGWTFDGNGLEKKVVDGTDPK